MKRIIKMTFMISFFLFNINSYGQLNYGIKGGLNLSNFAFNFARQSEAPDTQFKPGIHIGGIVSYNISEMLKVQSGLSISMKGFNYNHKDEIDGEATVSGYDRSTITYLILPIHGEYYFGDFSIMTGPYLGFGLSGKRKYDYVINDGGLDTEKGEEKYRFMSTVGPDDLRDNEIAIKGFDFGWDFGLGYLVTDALQINAEVSLGLVNLTPEMTDEPDFDPKDYKIHNRVISFGVTYFLGK